MTIDVSVVVPFFNPGVSIEGCLASLAAQTLEPQRFEAILIDDGSTDGSDQRVQRWISDHPDLATLIRIEPSGGPARPRNLGIDRARGRYVQFLDSDDALAPNALRRQLELADSSHADVVVGKLASDFRGIWHPLFRRTVTGRTLADYPLIQNVTVCKMFRREFLNLHGIRFPEGPRYIEDQQICVQSYAYARSVAVVADEVCYFYQRRRTGGQNRGDTRIDPGKYFRELEEIFDVIDAQVEESAQDACRSRYYRSEMLGRLRGRAMVRYHPDYRRVMLDEVRRVSAARIPTRIHDNLPVFLRAQSRLVINDDIDGLVALARQLESVRFVAHVGSPRWVDGRLVLNLSAEFRRDDEPFRLDASDAGWLLPAEMAPTLSVADRQVGSLVDVDIDLATVSRADSQLWSTTEGLALVVDDDGVPRVRCEVSLDPATVMGGRPLAGGLWDLRLRVMIGGLTRASALRAPVEDPADPPIWLSDGSRPRSVAVYWTKGSPSLALDVDEWMHPIADIVDGSSGGAAVVERRREFHLPLPRAVGPVGASRPARLVLVDDDDGVHPPLTSDATVELSPDGAILHATLPQLPSGVSRWSVWLALDDVGGTPPKRLAVTVAPGRFGKAVMVPTPDGVKPF
jgi:poly(ribitol-phosphate) beta-N-acetylglucosaminyltransferase